VRLPFLLYVPSGRLSGPTLKPVRCFLDCGPTASSSMGRLGAISVYLGVGAELDADRKRACSPQKHSRVGIFYRATVSAVLAGIGGCPIADF
jgi:hypothetical protein